MRHRRLRRLLVGPSAALAFVALTPHAARADDVLSKDVDLKITETAVLNYHFDNRDADHSNDKYQEWLNRLNVQATSGRFTAAVRIDSAVYASKPNPNRLADEQFEKLTPDQRAQMTPDELDRFRNLQVAKFGRDLSTRYVNAAYPSKIFVTYSQPGLDVTLGDYYVQLGRGLVLALRKVDEIGVDNTLRGGKVEYRPDLGGGAKVAVTALAGLFNPLRIDEVSGRQLTQTSKGFEGAAFPLMPHPRAIAVYDPLPQPTLSPDLVIGGRLEGGTKQVVFGVNGVQLTRSSDVTKAPFLSGNEANATKLVRKVQLVSVSGSVPNIADHGSLYVEVAKQNLDTPLPPIAPIPEQGITQTQGSDAELVRRLNGGYGVYALATAYEGPVTLTLEGKHYERLYPLAPSIDGRFSEFRTVQLSTPPTTELITNDTQLGQFNVCVTGGRARVDVRASDAALVYASTGYYVSYSETSNTCGKEIVADANGGTRERGKEPGIRNRVWDPFVGLEVNAENGRTHMYASTGVRFDDAGENVGQAGTAATTVFYREHWVRYDAVKKISGPFSLQAAGFHRYRFEPIRAALPWREGENYLSLQWAPMFTAAFGYEYSTEGGDWKHFYNGLLQYRVTTDTVIRTFVGQTRPALRCVSGVCRQFPAFEGAKLEVVVRL